MIQRMFTLALLRSHGPQHRRWSKGSHNARTFGGVLLRCPGPDLVLKEPGCFDSTSGFFGDVHQGDRLCTYPWCAENTATAVWFRVRSGGFGLSFLVYAGFSQFGERLIGILFLFEGGFDQRYGVLHAQFLRPRAKRPIPGNLVVLD